VRFKVLPEDFVVQEEIKLKPSKAGPYSIYRVEKWGVTTLQVQFQMARALKRPPSAVSLPALKDKKAIAIQYASVEGKGPALIEGNGFSARLVGHTRRHLTTRDLKGNRFTLTVRNIPPSQAEKAGERIAVMRESGLPNYFDRQRFGSYVPGKGFIGKKILERDAEGALRMYLTLPLPIDSLRIRSFKARAAEHWGDWELLLEEAPRPSNFRSVLTFLRDHPTDFRKALNLVTPRVLSLCLVAYQSWLWNRIVGRYLKKVLRHHRIPFVTLTIAGESLPFYFDLPPELLEALRQTRVPFLHHRAVFKDAELARIADDVLKEEGLTLWDFKARILNRAYLPKGERAVLLFPQDLSFSQGKDELFPGREKLILKFFLPPGSYATLIVKALAITTGLAPNEA